MSTSDIERILKQSQDATALNERFEKFEDRIKAKIESETNRLNDRVNERIKNAIDASESACDLKFSKKTTETQGILNSLKDEIKKEITSSKDSITKDLKLFKEQTTENVHKLDKRVEGLVIKLSLLSAGSGGIIGLIVTLISNMVSK